MLLLITCAQAAEHATADTGEIAEIVVLAQKRAQFAQNVPVSISVMTGEQMDNLGVQQIDDLAHHTPVLQMQSNRGVNTIDYHIRRVGNVGNIPTFEPAVGFFVDGAFRSRSFLGAQDLVDIERVEVLSGPQSTLYGKNTSAGVIAVYTRPPADHLRWSTEMEGGVIQGVETAPLGRFRFGVSGPMSDTLGASLSGAVSTHDYTVTSGVPSGPEQNSDFHYVVRGQLAWNGSEELDLRLIGGLFRENGRSGANTSVYFAPNAPSTQLRSLLEQLGYAQPCSANDSRVYTNCGIYPNTNDLTAEEATLLANYRLPTGWTLSSVTSVYAYNIENGQSDAAQLDSPIIKYFDYQSGRNWQEELRVTSAGRDTVDWMVGAFFFHDYFLRGGSNPTFVGDQYAGLPLWDQVIGVPFAVPGQVGNVNSMLTTKYIGIFNQATWNVAQQIHINAGIRWQREEKYADIAQYSNNPAPSVITLRLTPSTDANGESTNGALSRTANKVTWSVTPQYDLSGDTMFYATAARGFKSGGFNTGASNHALSARQFGDETIDHFEVGMKSMLMERRVQLNAAVFHTVYDDYQDAAFVNAQFTVGNAQKATTEGAELGLDARVTDRVSVDLNISYADLKYDTNTNGLCYPGRTPTYPSGSCDLSGQHPIDAPLTTASVGAEYRATDRFGSAYARIDADWSDRSNTSFSADPRLVQSSYTWLNARAGIERGHTEVVLWTQNLLNEHVADFEALLNFFNDASTQNFLKPPRSFGVTVRFKY